MSLIKKLFEDLQEEITTGTAEMCSTSNFNVDNILEAIKDLSKHTVMAEPLLVSRKDYERLKVWFDRYAQEAAAPSGPGFGLRFVQLRLVVGDHYEGPPVPIGPPWTHPQWKVEEE